MLRTCACFCTDFLMRHSHIITEKHKPVYIYGFELIISTLSSGVSILLLSVLLKHFLSGALFVLVFYGLRFFCGGYHAKAYKSCFFSTNLTYICTLLVATGLESLDQAFVPVILLLLSAIIIFILAPVKNKKHPISETVNRKNRKVALLLASLLLFAYLAMSLLNCSLNILSVLSSSIAAVAVLMLMPKLLERRKDYD